MTSKRKAAKAEETEVDAVPAPGATTPTADDVDHLSVDVDVPEPVAKNDGGGDPADGGGNVHLFTTEELEARHNEKAEARLARYIGHGNGDGYGNVREDSPRELTEGDDNDGPPKGLSSMHRDELEAECEARGIAIEEGDTVETLRDKLRG